MYTTAITLSKCQINPQDDGTLPLIDLEKADLVPNHGCIAFVPSTTVRFQLESENTLYREWKE